MYDWSSVDWSQSDPTIARQLGCNANTVMRNRALLGKPAYKAHHKVDWDKVDWEKTDAEIARAHNVHRSTVQRKRHTVDPRRRPQPAPLHDWSNVDWDKSNNALSLELKCSVTTVKHWRQRVGRPSVATHSKDQARKQQWEAWPEGAHKEIRLTIDYMDLHGGFIPARKMVERLREHWKVTTDEDALEAYSREVLNRRNWSTK